MKPTWFGWA